MPSKAHEDAFPRYFRLKLGILTGTCTNASKPHLARAARQSTASINDQMVGLLRAPSPADGLASHLPCDRHVSAELHGLMGHFTTAGSKSNRRNDCSKNDSIFHLKSPLSPPKGLSERIVLACYLRGSWNISAELHGLMRNFATAGSHSHSRNDRRYNDRALHNLHVFSPDASSAIAFIGLPVSPLQIKERGGFPTAFPTLRCENATPDQHDSHAPLTCHEKPGQAAATCRLAARIPPLART